MNIKTSVAIYAVTTLCTGVVLAQKEGTNMDNPPVNYNGSTQNYNSNDRDTFARSGMERLGKLERARDLLGVEIKNQQDERLGKVKDLAIDLQNGRIVEVIVARGGALGVDEELVAVPPDQFNYYGANKYLLLRADKQQLKAAPAFKMSDWEENVRQARVEEVYKYYASEPYFKSEMTFGHNVIRTPNQLNEVDRASKLIGTPVRNLQDERLGKVENLVVDLPAGRVVEVIVASGSFLGLGGELSAIPPQSVKYGIHRDLLTLDTTKDALTRAPHFKASEWENANNQVQIWSVYHSYNVEPYFTTNAADNTAQNVRDRYTNTITPLDQGNSQADMDTTQQIRQQIMAVTGLSMDAQNVKVITRDGRVTLRGPVANEQEKRTIADIAAKIASPTGVDDQLQVINANSNTTK